MKTKPKYKVGDKVVFYRNTKEWGGDEPTVVPARKGNIYIITGVNTYKNSKGKYIWGYQLNTDLYRWWVPASCIKPAL